GRILYIEGAVEEVSEGERANGLPVGAEHFRAIFDASKLAILLLDLQGLVLEANPAFRRAFGYDPAFLHGRPLAELAVPEERARVVDEQRALVEGGTARAEAERRFLSADGTVLWARCLAVRMTDVHG